MKKILTVLAMLLVGLSSTVSFATPEKGWHRGTYYLFGLGFLNNDEDTNVLTNRAFGSTNILGYGLTLGWNILDFLGLELDMRYGTERANNQREHAANIDINAKYSFIFDALTRSDLFRFLPFLKLGAGIYGAAVPDTSAGNDRFGVVGPSMVIGTGMEALFKNWLYVGFDFTTNLVWLQQKTNSQGQRILNGGFDGQYSVFGRFGVHF